MVRFTATPGNVLFLKPCRTRFPWIVLKLRIILSLGKCAGSGLLSPLTCGSLDKVPCSLRSGQWPQNVAAPHAKPSPTNSWWDQSRNYWKWIFPFFYSSTQDVPSCALCSRTSCMFPHGCAYMHVYGAQCVYEYIHHYIRKCIRNPCFFCLVTQGDQRILFRSNNTEYYLTFLGEVKPAGCGCVSVCKQNRTVSAGERFSQVAHCDHTASFWSSAWWEH